MHSILKHPGLFLASIAAGLLTPLLIYSCIKEEKAYNTEVGPVEETSNSDIRIITIEDHEYILWDASGHDTRGIGGICHSESCSHIKHTAYGNSTISQ